jgi:hypothetical protein
LEAVLNSGADFYQEYFLEADSFEIGPRTSLQYADFELGADYLG